MAKVSHLAFYVCLFQPITINCQDKDKTLCHPFSLALSGSSRISETGQTGFFTEVVLGLKEKKAGKLGVMKNW